MDARHKTPQQLPEKADGQAEDGSGERVAEVPGDDELSAVELRILAFEDQWWKYAGAKETAIRETFDVSTVRYFQSWMR